jgi:uncharacterized protein YggT (Ycf19 family)
MYKDHELGVVFHHGVLARHPFPLRLAQVLNVLFTAVYALLATRFLLVYVQAAPSPFAYWVARATDPVYVPLRELFKNGHDAAGHPLAWALVITMLALVAVQWSLVSWLREVARPGIPVDDD